MENSQDESFFNVSRCSFDASRECRKSPQRQSQKATRPALEVGRASGFRNRGRGSSLKGQKVTYQIPRQVRQHVGGRGAQPVWLREKLKGGAKLEDFAVGKTVASRNASPRKTSDFAWATGPSSIRASSIRAIVIMTNAVETNRISGLSLKLVRHLLLPCIESARWDTTMTLARLEPTNCV
jgi:hypothetical protein